ncbi:hypothetical protein [Actinoallomurus liliacearum]
MTDATSGPQSLEEEITASLMILRRILTAGRIPPITPLPHQLPADVLIDFWADDLAPEQDSEQ